MKAAVYLRVSSKDGRQDEANQEPDCARLCAGRGWEPVFFRERESGAKERAVWKQVMEEARLGRVGAVVFWAMDRVGRNRTQVTHDLGNLFRYNVVVASVRESWIEQPMGPVRDILLQFMAWIAEGERARLVERTNAGLARARAKGVRLGRKPSSEVHENLAAAVAEVRAGLPAKRVARERGIPRSTLRDAVAEDGAKKGAS